MAILTLVFGRDILGTFDVNGDRMIIGRADDCEIVIDNLAVSRHHAIIERKDGGFQIKDLDSNNGTFVNGHRITEGTSLNFGDEIGIGKHVIVFDSHSKKQQLPDSLLMKEAVPDMDSPARGTMFVEPEKMAKIQKKGNTARKAHLLMKENGHAETMMPLDQKDVVFGKSPECDIKIKGFFCSRRQAILSRLENGFEITHMGIFSSTKVNGVPIQSAFLCDGDEITMGKTAFIFHSDR